MQAPTYTSNQFLMSGSGKIFVMNLLKTFQRERFDRWTGHAHAPELRWLLSAVCPLPTLMKITLVDLN